MNRKKRQNPKVGVEKKMNCPGTKRQIIGKEQVRWQYTPCPVVERVPAISCHQIVQQYDCQEYPGCGKRSDVEFERLVERQNCDEFRFQFKRSSINCEDIRKMRTLAEISYIGQQHTRSESNPRSTVFHQNTVTARIPGRSIFTG